MSPPQTRTRKRTTSKPAPPAAPAPAKRAPGRPRKLEIDPDLRTRITDAVELGVHPERAAVAAGVTERSHYLWQAKGLEEREHREAGKKPRATFQVFLDYVDAIDQATAKAEIELVKSARNGGNPAALMILERRFRERWSAKPTAASSKPTAASGPTATTPLGQLEERRRAREQAAR